MVKRAIPKDERDELKKRALATVAAGEFSRKGFAAFLELIDGAPPFPHLVQAIDHCFTAHEQGVPFIFQGFRGCRKTTTFSVKFVAYFIGHFPEKANLIPGATDGNPEDITKHIAQIIEFHPDWKRTFPHIVPDKTGEGKGWSASGYFVTDTRMTREEWTKLQTSVIDPTFVGGGYASARINGKHPSGILAPDDILDIESSLSQTERDRIKYVYFGQIAKTVVRKNDKLVTWVNFSCVPFARDDVYQTVIDSGNCVLYRLPCMTRAAEGADGAIYIDGLNKATGAVYEDIKGWWFLTCPELFGVDSVLQERSTGKSWFWQMYMMDINMAKATSLVYHLYDHTKIDPYWLHGGGCDFATLGTNLNVPDKGRDKFSVAVGGKTPMNQVVVDNGFIGQVTQAEAEARLQSAQDAHRSWKGTKLEVTGSGEQFYLQVVRRNKGLILTQGKAGHKSKEDRIMKELGPWLENGQVLISDEMTPYLQELRQALDDFPDGNKDIRDGLYYLALNFPECLVSNAPDAGLPRKDRKPKGLFTPWAGAQRA